MKNAIIILNLILLCFACRSEKESDKQKKAAEKQQVLDENIDGEENSSDDLIRVVQPHKNQEISNPITIRGEARGKWFFEAVAPVLLIDQDKDTLAQGFVKAQGDWMTENFVPFRGELFFEVPNMSRGSLILQRANASGKPEHDRSVRIPVLFPKSD